MSRNNRVAVRVNGKNHIADRGIPVFSVSAYFARRIGNLLLAPFDYIRRTGIQVPGNPLNSKFRCMYLVKIMQQVVLIRVHEFIL